MPHVEDFLTPDQEKQIIEAIRTAEKNTSGEIRVHLENKTSIEPLQRAMEVFRMLKMEATEQRNGVLFYFAVDDKKFAIYGDEGINKLVPTDFWDKTRETMQNCFRKGEFCQGIIDGILLAGQELKRFFPCRKNDENQLSDEISKGKME